MLFVPRPRPIHRHFGSVVFIASSVRQTPPPAVPTHSRHPPLRAQRGEIASVETRPDTFAVAPLALTSVVSGPIDVQTLPLAVVPR